jgi:hypothetical protein
MDQTDFQEAVEGIREGYEDLMAGRTRSADEAFEELRIEHGIDHGQGQPRVDNHSLTVAATNGAAGHEFRSRARQQAVSGPAR